MNFSIDVLTAMDGLPKLKRKIELAILASSEYVEVGVIDDGSGREENPGITSAYLASIHENGAPASNVPKRPFMGPAVEETKVEVYRALSPASRRHFKNRAFASKEALLESGAIIANKMREKLEGGLSPGLGADTIIKGIQKGRTDFRPLMDTKQIYKSIKHRLVKR